MIERETLEEFCKMTKVTRPESILSGDKPARGIRYTMLTDMETGEIKFHYNVEKICPLRYNLEKVSENDAKGILRLCYDIIENMDSSEKISELLIKVEETNLFDSGETVNFLLTLKKLFDSH